jgi:hypothetical protein
MNLTEEQKQIIVNAGEIGISNETLAYQLQFDEAELIKEMKNNQSIVSKYYRIGQECYLVDVYGAMKDKALTGDTEAVKMLLKIRQEHSYQKTSRELFGS